MPSSLGRIVLLLPIAVIIAKNFGFKEHDNGYVGIMLAFIFSTVIPAFAILPANVPNMILSGLTHEIYGFELLYSHYLVANFFVDHYEKPIYENGIQLTDMIYLKKNLDVVLDVKRVVDMAMHAGRILLKNGGEIFRVEETIKRIYRSCKQR